MIEIKNFCVEKQFLNVIDWIKTYFAENGNENTKAVIGLSGGKDSTIAATLLCTALGPERVVAVMMPEGEQADIEDSYKVCDFLNLPPENRIEINIHNTLKALYNEAVCVDNNIGKWTNPAIITNTPARIRMTILYMVAAAVGGRVCHTGNRSEMYVGFTTKYGDLAGDFSLFKRFVATEVIALGDYLTKTLGLPAELVHKAPSDGMCGQTDEDKLGFSYEDLDNYILNDVTPPMDMFHKIVERHKLAKHKDVLNLPAPHRITYIDGEKGVWGI